jgi:hypothetical protein
MKKFVLIAALLMCGCASQIMQGYVGKPVSEAVMDYGQPVAAIELDKNKKAFVWSQTHSTISPGYSNTSGSIYGTGSSAFFNSSTYTSPAYVSTSQCNYTLYAERTRKDIDGPAAWTVVGYKEPNIMCQ